MTDYRTKDEIGNIILYTNLGAVSEIVTKNVDNYTIAINKNMSQEKQLESYHHALKHIINGDFDSFSVQSIESNAHKRDAV